MTTQIIIPEDLWEEDSEAVITSWLASDGATVSKGALLAEIMTEKIQHEIESPADGTLKILKQIDDIINKGDVIGTIE
ncbi:MAG: lipoyl domain-containing protein [Robiginitomaculum sp.]|nr:lipoyl domain-containing protein [Robiginitomaculum sp.]